MEMIKKIGSSYMGFAIGTLFGAVISTLTSYYIFSIAMGDPDAAVILGIQECLEERLNE